MLERLRPLDPVRVVLFGSAARGDADAASDLDVIVVAEDVPARFADRLAVAYELIDPTFALDILVYTPDEYAQMQADANPLIAAAERDGQVVHARPAA